LRLLEGTRGLQPTYFTHSQRMQGGKRHSRKRAGLTRKRLAPMGPAESGEEMVRGKKGVKKPLSGCATVVERRLANG